MGIMDGCELPMWVLGTESQSLSHHFKPGLAASNVGNICHVAKGVPMARKLQTNLKQLVFQECLDHQLLCSTFKRTVFVGCQGIEAKYLDS